MAAAGLGDDLLLANEVVGAAADRLGALARSGSARVTAAVDSDATVDAAAAAGVREVLVDVNCGLPRCGCDPVDAGRLADRARAAGLDVRGVMGYEGHLMREPEDRKRAEVAKAGDIMRKALAEVGGDVISGGGTGTWATNDWATELQAGSYCLMDTEYVPHAAGFANALTLVCTLVSANERWGVLDGGLKSLGMDHGDPRVDPGVGDCWFVSDEHTTFGWHDGARLPSAARVRVMPGARRPDGRVPRAPARARRRGGGGHVARRPPRLVVAALVLLVAAGARRRLRRHHRARRAPAAHPGRRATEVDSVFHDDFSSGTSEVQVDGRIGPAAAPPRRARKRSPASCGQTYPRRFDTVSVELDGDDVRFTRGDLQELFGARPAPPRRAGVRRRRRAPACAPPPGTASSCSSSAPAPS